ncbi:MAG: serpin family protein [Crocosphaera sp.]|nr:serpin family protein [Crocosphaera sp.]
MRTLKMTKAVGLLSLCILSGLVAFSKTYFSTVFKDVPGLQEVSPRMIFPKRTLDKKPLVDQQVQFGFKLLTGLANSRKKENIFISPTSISLTLSMLYNGATGRTRQEISQGLALRNIKTDTLNRTNHSLEMDLKTYDPYSRLVTTNSLWAKEGFPFRYQFLKTNRTYYQAKITNLDFSSSEARGIINRWVTEETEQKIPEIINQTKADDVLFLINTAYFQGVWQIGFDRSLTTNKSFHLTDKSVKTYPFLSRQGTYNYLKTPQFKGVEIPYGDGRFSLYLFLPRLENTLASFVQTLTPKKLAKHLSQFRPTQGLLALPRFTLNDEIDLTNALKALGFSTMFDASKAEFAALSSYPTYVNGIKHQTFLEINEQGVEEPSQEYFMIKRGSIYQEKQGFSFVVDRPFFCMIRDNKTGNILFMGIIYEP